MSGPFVTLDHVVVGVVVKAVRAVNSVDRMEGAAVAVAVCLRVERGQAAGAVVAVGAPVRAGEPPQAVVGETLAGRALGLRSDIAETEEVSKSLVASIDAALPEAAQLAVRSFAMRQRGFPKDDLTSVSCRQGITGSKTSQRAFSPTSSSVSMVPIEPGHGLRTHTPNACIS